MTTPTTQRFTQEFLNEPIARHARTDATQIRPEWTIGETLEFLRENPPGGRVIYFYVTEATGKLVGVVPTRRLLLNAAHTLIRDVMIARIVAVPEHATVLETCEFFSMHRLLALPIVDSQKRLVGVVDVDLYTDELADLGGVMGDDVFQLIGVHLSAANQARPWKAVRGRFPWLLCNVAGGLVAAMLSGIYQDVLNWEHAVLALFVPVVLALAESVAIQSVTLTLQTLHTLTPSWGTLVRRSISEGATGLLLGLGTGGVVAGVAAVWLGNTRVSLIVLGGITGGVMMAAMAGLMVPFVLRLMRRDPQLAAGPITLAAADFATLLLYFTLGRFVS